MVRMFGLKRLAKRTWRRATGQIETPPCGHDALQADGTFLHGPSDDAPTVDFQCNVCGTVNLKVERRRVENRETPSCGVCHSSLRMRSVIHALSTALFSKSLAIHAFPQNPSLKGLGMSDWDGYASRLGGRLNYVNTFYHTEPRLDITDVPLKMHGLYDFLISSDVFEHIPPSGLKAAFANARALLSEGGVFVLTVPFTKSGSTIEHFPRLHDFQIVEAGGHHILHNTTLDGEHEVFDQLVFHGGPGMTLEMRRFSEPDLISLLTEAGFRTVRVHTDIVPEQGILWPIDYAVPIVARV